MQTDIMIVGGGVGGCAAALAAAGLGYRVVLSEATRWIGGQLTSQAVPPDEHPWIESCGCTASYRRFRDGVRDYCRKHKGYHRQAVLDPLLNPGLGMVSGICHEPTAALAVLESMLAPLQQSGQLTVLCEHTPIAAETQADRVTSVTLKSSVTGELKQILAPYLLDATELGDLLALAGVEYQTGAESQQQTGEPHAVDGPAQPDNVQALTWCFPLAYDPARGADHTLEPPGQYRHWRDYVPRLHPPWTGPLLSWDAIHPISLKPRRFELFGDPAKGDFSSLWHYRRIVAAEHFPPSQLPHEVTCVNWPQNDYIEGNIIDASPENASRYLEEARQLSLSLFHWLQTEAPRPDGGTGYPGLYLDAALTGSPDGMAQAPYIRESRRIIARQTVTECDVGAAARGGRAASFFSDSVGIGYYRIDLHPSTGGDNYIDIASMPFQIPLGALLPVRVENLIPACKNIGTTHISNGCYRLHPVEWNIGEAAGLLAAFCISEGTQPDGVRDNPRRLQDFQNLLLRQGIELQWQDSILEQARQNYQNERAR